MPAGYAARRFGIFFLVLWVAATINFAIPRLSPANPIRERLLQAVSAGGLNMGSMDEVVKSYEARFGLDQPLWVQYVRYLGDLARFDFGLSITMFPTRVIDIILIALPWTIVLLTVATLLACGTTSPLHSGQWRPQPAPDPLARTNAPQAMTSRL